MKFIEIRRSRNSWRFMEMAMLQGKRIALGICGGIAAYKIADLVSKLQQAGALVDVILTRARG